MMGMVLAAVGAASFVGYLVWLIVRIVQWDSKIPPVIGMLLSLVMLVGGLSAMPQVRQAVDDMSARAAAVVEVVRSFKSGPEDGGDGVPN